MECTQESQKTLIETTQEYYTQVYSDHEAKAARGNSESFGKLR